MTPLRNLREVLGNLAKEVEVLSAVGGAVEDLERPDFEEREDQALNEEERVFDTIFEKSQDGTRPALYRPTPPLPRHKRHLFRYFLDGSFRSFFLGTLLEHERESPIHFAQIGACVLHRKDDGSVRREDLKIRNLLLAGKKRLSPELWNKLENAARMAGLTLVDLEERDIVSRVLSDFDLRNKAAGKVRFEMHNLEAELIRQILPKLQLSQWLVVDGSLQFQPTFKDLEQSGVIKPVLGVAKNFRKDPLFVFGRGPGAERRSIYKLLADLKPYHRTAAFSARQGKLVFWYVRLREQTQVDYPLMGVVKAELVNPSQEAVPSELIDLLSCALVAERSVTPHGQDRRWHAHLYPIFLAERAIKESLVSREVVQQFLKWR